MISIPENAFTNCHTAIELCEIMSKHNALHEITPKGHKLLQYLARRIDLGYLRDNSLEIDIENTAKELNMLDDLLLGNLLFFHKIFFARLSYRNGEFTYHSVGIIQTIVWNTGRSSYTIRFDPEWLACLHSGTIGGKHEK